MRTPEPRTTRSGATTYKVRFRLSGKETSETFDTEKEALRFCVLLDTLGSAGAVAQLADDTRAADEMTLDDWAKRHFDSLTGVTPGTLVTYRRIYDRAWSPTLGRLPLSHVTRERIAVTLNALPGADKTVRNAHGVLAAMMKSALRDRHITFNPCAGIKLPRRTDHERTEHRYLTQAEFAALLAEIPDHWQPLVWMLAGTGMRWGEAEALNVGDVDLRAGTVRVTKAVKWDSSKSTRDVGPTKTKRSRRTITLPPETIEAVRPLLAGRKSGDRLFLAPKGGPVRHRTFWHDIWRKAIERCGIEPPPTIHSLRHSHVAWLIGEGIPLPVIQARLGHESIQTTVDVYGHLLPDLQRAAADAASVALRGVGVRAIEASPSR